MPLTKRRVAAEHGPGLLTPGAVDEEKAVCSGRWPGVCIARIVTVPDLELETVGDRHVVVAGLGVLMDVDPAPVAAASRPWPETWSA